MSKTAAAEAASGGRDGRFQAAWLVPGLLLILLAVVVRSGAAMVWDRSIASWMAAGCPPACQTWARAVTWLGSTPWLLAAGGGRKGA